MLAVHRCPHSKQCKLLRPLATHKFMRALTFWLHLLALFFRKRSRTQAGVADAPQETACELARVAAERIISTGVGAAAAAVAASNMVSLGYVCSLGPAQHAGQSA